MSVFGHFGPFPVVPTVVSICVRDVVRENHIVVGSDVWVLSGYVVPVLIGGSQVLLRVGRTGTPPPTNGLTGTPMPSLRSYWYPNPFPNGLTGVSTPSYRFYWYPTPLPTGLTGTPPSSTIEPIVVVPVIQESPTTVPPPPTTSNMDLHEGRGVVLGGPKGVSRRPYTVDVSTGYTGYILVGFRVTTLEIEVTRLTVEGLT